MELGSGAQGNDMALPPHSYPLPPKFPSISPHYPHFSSETFTTATPPQKPYYQQKPSCY